MPQLSKIPRSALLRKTTHFLHDYMYHSTCNQLKLCWYTAFSYSLGNGDFDVFPIWSVRSNYRISVAFHRKWGWPIRSHGQHTAEGIHRHDTFHKHAWYDPRQWSQDILWERVHWRIPRGRDVTPDCYLLALTCPSNSHQLAFRWAFKLK